MKLIDVVARYHFTELYAEKGLTTTEEKIAYISKEIQLEKMHAFAEKLATMSLEDQLNALQYFVLIDWERPAPYYP